MTSLIISTNSMLAQQIAPRKIYHRQKFTPIEDQLLTQLVAQYGSNNWQAVSRGMINRTPKQCKDHYINYIMPCSVNLPFSEEEDKIIILKYSEFGPKWTKMLAFLPGRTANSLKNRWNFHLSKQYFNQFSIFSNNHVFQSEMSDLISSDESNDITVKENQPVSLSENDDDHFQSEREDDNLEQLENGDNAPCELTEFDFVYEQFDQISSEFFNDVYEYSNDFELYDM